MNELTPEDSSADDPIVAEVRRIREEIAARFDFDLKRIADHAEQVSRAWRDGQVSHASSDAKSDGAPANYIDPAGGS